MDRRTLPRGYYRDEGFEARQVVDIDIGLRVTGYRAQVLTNEAGQRFVAEFPAKVSRPIQYGASIKVHAVYLSQYQLLPYNRIVDYFQEQLGIPLSEDIERRIGTFLLKVISSVHRRMKSRDIRDSEGDSNARSPGICSSDCGTTKPTCSGSWKTRPRPARIIRAKTIAA